MRESVKISLFISLTILVVTIVLIHTYTGGQKSIIASNAREIVQNKMTVESAWVTNSFDCTKDTWKTWIPPNVPSDIQAARQDNPALIDHIKKNWLIPPCSGDQRNLARPNKRDFSQWGQGNFIDKYLNKTHGFYIECGGYDGESFSNSLGFEIYKQWDGLLIEGDPHHFKTLLSKHRRAFKINACLSPYNYASKFNFSTNVQISGLTNQRKVLKKFLAGMKDEVGLTTIQNQCFPFYSIFSALENRIAGASKLHVDLFSLDIEGAEVDILKTIPFDKVDIQLFLVEYLVPHEPVLSKEKWNWIEKFLGSKGYHVVPGCPDRTDIIMEKK